MSTFKHFISLVKFSHTIFALPFALIGFTWGYVDYIGMLADTPIQFGSKLFYSIIAVILCMVFARNAAMGFNRYIDRDFDAKNNRTAQREIPAGIISPTAALVFVLVNCVLFALVCYFINDLCFVLSPIALFIVLGYSFTKRFTSLCHFVLGLGLAIAPMGAYIVVQGHFAWAPAFFSILVFTWVSGFDILYALADDEFDRSEGLHSIPAALGRKQALNLSKLLHFLSALIVIYIGYRFHMSYFYWVGASIFIGLLIYQHTLVGPQNLSRLNAAFFTTNGIASVLFACFTIVDKIIN